MSGWISLVVAVVLVVVAYLVLNRTITSRTNQQVALDDIKREIGSILTELNSTTERNIELIEDRIEALHRAIDEADRRLGALRRDADRVQQKQGSTYEHLGRHRSPVVDPEPKDEFVVTRDGKVHQDRKSQTPIAQRVASSQIVSRAPTEPTPRERIRELYLAGLPLERIASAVGKTVGEIELIVSLDEGKRGRDAEREA